MSGFNFRAERFLTCFALIMGWNLAIASSGWAEEVTVQLRSGRSFTGAVDARTDDAQLWLRYPAGSMVVTRPIAWSSVATVVHGDNQFSAEEFRSEAGRLKAKFIPTFDPPASANATPAPAIVFGERSAPPLRPPRVRTIYVDVDVANWDSDVEVDGLLLHLFPVAGGGMVVPVDGVLEVDLRGEQLGIAHDRQPFPELGRWTQTVRLTDFGPAGAVYQLPFQQWHPDFNLDLGAQGLVHARLTIPGHGTFEASQGMVRIRPYSALRDKLQQHEQRRFFPSEMTGRTP